MKVKLRLFDTGYCLGKQSHAIQGGMRSKCEFHAPFALIEHPQQGYCLFDTGYAQRFYDASARFPYNLYAKLTPVFHKPENSAIHLMNRIGIQAQDIHLIIVSHFHADHICGLKDFPEARFLCARNAYQGIRGKKGFAAVTRGFLPDLMPADIESRMSFIEDRPVIELAEIYRPFDTGYDVFGDGSVIAVRLEGHASGQMGILVETEAGPCFLVADASWLSQSYRENRLPGRVARFIFSDRKAYAENLRKLHELHTHNPTLRIVPSHCPEVLQLIDTPR